MGICFLSPNPYSSTPIPTALNADSYPASDKIVLIGIMIPQCKFLAVNR
nr:MAG TPA_asm: hypothetical protein [Caudoviricetes sp.]